MFLGSRGGYLAFRQSMLEVRRHVVKKGAVYLVEHRYKPENESLMLDFKSMGMDLDEHEVKDGMCLKNGFYTCRGIEDERNPHRSKRKVPAIALREGGEGIYFHDFETVLGIEDMCNFQIDKAHESGYKNDMAIVFLSGYGGDGCKSLENAGKLGTRVFIQEPETAAVKQMPNNAIQTAKMLNLDFDVLPPYGIGRKIDEFLTD